MRGPRRGGGGDVATCGRAPAGALYAIGWPDGKRLPYSPRAVRKVRVAFIGAGSLANRRHYPSLAGMADVELAAVCDLAPERARATAERWGIERTYQDYKQMLAEVEPEAVYIVMPPQHLFQPVV